LCEGVGFQNVTTYIQSGNVVFTSDLTAHEAKKKLEAVLRKKLGKAVRVRLRTSKALAAILERNPFKHAARRAWEGWPIWREKLFVSVARNAVRAAAFSRQTN
jgi:uncharacterized protein (DUF1697 family)